MSVIVVTKRLGNASKIHLGPVLMSLLALIALAMAGGLIYTGYKLGAQQSQPDVMVHTLQRELDRHKMELESLSRSSGENLNALAMRLGQLKAHVIRLDALGERLIQMADLDKGEFDFDKSPAVGGPERLSDRNASGMKVPDFVKSMEQLSSQIEHRSLQLAVLESMLMNRNLQGEVYPAGRPVKKGWTSSYYGLRTDPFTGRIAHHDGVDIAGREGSDVIAVAAGVVTWAGRRYGYGNLVEINHGNGYVTRYAHNKQILVEVGDTVKKGETLSTMGSSGRSTGPHVHFEVIKNGRVVDPANYLQARR